MGNIMFTVSKYSTDGTTSGYILALQGKSEFFIVTLEKKDLECVRTIWRYTDEFDLGNKVQRLDDIVTKFQSDPTIRADFHAHRVDNFNIYSSSLLNDEVLERYLSSIVEHSFISENYICPN